VGTCACVAGIVNKTTSSEARIEYFFKKMDLRLTDKL